MEFFNKIGKKASEAYKMTADKTGKIAKETKIKLKITELKTQIDDVYEEIGKKVYEKHIREEDISIEQELEEKCTKIDVLSDEIDTLLKQCLELKDKKQCPKCYAEIEKEVKYCPNCGKKQTAKPSLEEEKLEGVENTDVKEENEKEKEIVKEEIKENFEKQENELEEVENSNEEENNSQEEEEKSNLEKTVEVESDVKKDE